MASFVDGNNTSSRSLHGQTQVFGGADSQVMQDMYRLQILYSQVLVTIELALSQFSGGNFNTLKDLLPESTFLSLGQTISDDATFYNTDVTNLVDFVHDELTFSRFRNISYKIVDGLKQAISEYDAKITLETENIELQQYKTILEDKDRLLTYLNTVQKETFLFSAEASFETTLILKPWYRVYLERYGAPGDGVFETELLAAIVDELLLSGEITYTDLEGFTISD